MALDTEKKAEKAEKAVKFNSANPFDEALQQWVSVGRNVSSLFGTL